MGTALAKGQDVAPAETDKTHPMKVWLGNHGYTQTWLGIKLRPQKPIDQRHIYLWFSRRTKPRKAMIEKMAALTKGEVTVEEIEEFHAIRRVLKSRRGDDREKKKAARTPQRPLAVVTPLKKKVGS